MKRRAIISVSNKEGIVEFAKEIEKLDFEIISTGGTYKLLKDNGVSVKNISEVTEFPEIMDGRVKTLHPKVHGGILAIRENENHIREAQENNITMIDLLVVNLYPFEETINKENVSLDEAIENIDIGGPTMIRAAAKNYKYVTIVTDPADYNLVLKEFKTLGNTTLETRKKLALKVFTLTSRYDSEIQKYLAKVFFDEQRDYVFLTEGQKLRYGENSHQSAYFYPKKSKKEATLGNIEVLHGKELSYNNYVDSEAALEIVKDYNEKPSVAIIKHTNPCGFACGETLEEAFLHAWEGDVVSAFGSVIALNRVFDYNTALLTKGKFIEVILAPDFEPKALEFLKEKSKNLRLIKVNGDFGIREEKVVYKNIIGGFLKQDRDSELWKEFKVVTETPFSENKIELAKFTWIASKHTKSNAIVLGYEYNPNKFMVLGMGAGQPNRIDSLRKLAATKAKENLERMYDSGLIPSNNLSKEEFIKEAFANVVLASDAFFPFADTIEVCNELGIKYIVQPGGSVRDKEVIDACNKYGISMVFTGTRHFRH